MNDHDSNDEGVRPPLMELCPLAQESGPLWQLGWLHVCHSVIITHLNVRPPPLSPSLATHHKHAVGGHAVVFRRWRLLSGIEVLFHFRTLLFDEVTGTDLGFWREKMAPKYKKWEENSLFWWAVTLSLCESWRLILEPFLEIEIDEKTKSSILLPVSVFCQLAPEKTWIRMRSGSGSAMQIRNTAINIKTYSYHWWVKRLYEQNYLSLLISFSCLRFIGIIGVS